MSLLFFRILMCVHAEPMDSQVLETNPISDWPSLSKCSHWCYPGYKIRFSSASAHCTTRAYLVWNRGNRHTPIRHGHGALTQMEPETTLELGLGAESEITGHRGGQVTVSVWVEDALPDRIVDRRCVIRGTTTHLWFLRHLRNRLYRKPIYIFAWLKSVCRHKVAICHHMNKQSVDILMIRVGWALGMRVIVVNAGDSQMGVPIIINYIAVVSLSTLSVCTGRGNCMFSNIIERCLRASRYETNMNEQ